jgi:two-component system response regulator YcbB
MAARFVVVDDDVSVRKIIRHIIDGNDLGTVVAECGDGLEAERVIAASRPDIAVIDLLLPGQDGVELIRKLNEQRLPVSFIMISESSSQPMITQAYNHGIEFYIHKPVNVSEIVTVVNRVKESRDLKKAMSLISQATAQYAAPAAGPAADGNRAKNITYKVFSDLGILGEAGAKSIYQMTKLLAGGIRTTDDTPYQLHELYQRMAREAGQDAKTIEQRVRRAIAKALQNLASLGIEDARSERFQTYGTALFDFSEVRQEMSFAQGKSPYHGKINVKKFIQGLMFLATKEQ